MPLSVGRQLEKKGWLQGSIISDLSGLPLIHRGILVDITPEKLSESNFVLIVATQSCNIANEAVNTVQLAVGYHIDSRSKNREFNKHPREIDTWYNSICSIGNEEVIVLEKSIRINVLEKIFIPKELLLGVELSEDLVFQDYEKSSFVDWLGSHYMKPALPTQFNDLIAAVKKRNSKKFRSKEKALITSFLGVYVNIYPNRDLNNGEQYKVKLLGLVKPQSDLDIAEKCLENYSTILSEAGMDVTKTAKHSTKVSVAVLQDFKRLYLDELSYSQEEDTPPDVKPGIF
jgi:hypothetical protein